MKRILFATSAMLLVTSQFSAFADPPTLSPAGEAGDFARWQGNGTDVHVDNGVMTIKFPVADWPNAHVTSTAPWNWSDNGVAVDIANPGKSAVEFHLRLDDSGSSDGGHDCAYGAATIEPGERAVFSSGFGPPQQDPPIMRGYPSVFTGTKPMHVSIAAPFDPSHIMAMQIFLDHPKQPSTLIVHRIELTPAADLNGIVDEFGQYTRVDWPGKVHKLSDLTARAKSEDDALQEAPALPGLDQFGGWEAGPQLAKSTYFRTQKVNGKWWLVTPAGHLFFSTGIDSMYDGDETLMDGSHRRMFTWLPEPPTPNPSLKGGEIVDPLYKHTGDRTWTFGGKTVRGRAIDFYAINLERKYGPDFEHKWVEISQRRMRAWGFNTVGNWSGPLQPNPTVPYVATLGIGGDHKRVSGGWDYWGQMHDPYDPQFAKDVADSVAGVAAKVKDDPLCVGYFVDNELSWAGWDGKRGPLQIGYGALSLDASTSPAKQAMVDQMKTEYATVDALNKAWGTTFATWDDFAKPYSPQGDASDAMARDLDAYVGRFATQYFTVVRDALKAVDPNHLYLGCRFAAFSPTIVESAAKVVDVVSFNIYAKTIDANKFGFLTTLDKPCIIGEFHFGAMDRGMFSPGLVEAPDQAGRGVMYRNFIDSVLATSMFVGAHWFEYEDEPLTGRFDGENYQIGLVSVTDTPYPELVKAAQAEHRSMYAKRYGK